MAMTQKIQQFGRAPRRRTLQGDRARAIESATHAIEFPGGNVEVSRTSDGAYWAHIYINRRDVVPDCEGTLSARGRILGTRVDTPAGVVPLPVEQFDHVAILIGRE